MREDITDLPLHLFDLHGTLVDNYSHGARIVEILLQRLGISQSHENYPSAFNEGTMRRLGAGETITALQELFPEIDEGKGIATLQEISAVNQPKLVRGAVDYLRLLVEKKARIGVVTNTRTDRANMHLDALPNLRSFFKCEDVICLKRNESSSRRKPASTLYTRALRHFGFPGELTVAYEDTTKGVTAACRAGVEKVIGLGTTAYTSEEELLQHGASRVIRDFSVLLQ